MLATYTQVYLQDNVATCVTICVEYDDRCPDILLQSIGLPSSSHTTPNSIRSNGSCTDDAHTEDLFEKRNMLGALDYINNHTITKLALVY
jgi:hypothetical protein